MSSIPAMRRPVSASASGTFGVTTAARAMKRRSSASSARGSKSARPGRRDHDRIDDQRHGRRQLLDRIAGDFDDAVIQKHAGLDAIGADIAEHALDLAFHEIRRHGQDALNADGVLRGERGDRRRRIGAERRHRFDIRLDAGAAARIRAGDDQHAAVHSAALIPRGFPLRPVRRPPWPLARSLRLPRSTELLVLALGHDADERLGAGFAHEQPARRAETLFPAPIAALYRVGLRARAPPSQRTLCSICGIGSKTLPTWLTGASVSTIAASTCSAAMRPSPVVE